MVKLSEYAKNYEPAKTKNIADLDIVDVNSSVEVRVGKDQEGKDYTYHVIVIDGVDYRVPDMVLASLKGILAKRPELKQFQVSKSGQGMATRYTVIPIA